jgi:chromate transporter
VTGEQARIPLLRLFWFWAKIGAQSFGGGATTSLMIQRTFVDGVRAISAEEYARRWAISHIPPGINLFALVIQLGHKFGGWPGIAVSMLGFTLPSSAITMAMTALWSTVNGQPWAQAALRGIAPAVVALGMVMCWNVLDPILRGKSKTLPRWFAYALALGCAVVALSLNVSPFIVFIISGLLGCVAAVANEKLKEQNY